MICFAVILVKILVKFVFTISDDSACHGQSKMEYEQRDLFTHLPCGRGAACAEARQQTFPDEMTDSVGLQLVFNCTNIVATLGPNF